MSNLPENTTPAIVHPHADLIAGLRELTTLLESRPDLAVGKYSIGLSLGALKSRADLDAWASVFGAEIVMGGTAGDIPVMRAEVHGLPVSAQAPAEPEHNRLTQLEQENARLRAELATRTESDDRCKCGFRAPELGPHPACPVHAEPAPDRTESDR